MQSYMSPMLSTRALYKLFCVGILWFCGLTVQGQTLTFQHTSFCAPSNLAATYLGSYGLTYSVADGTLNIHVWNYSTINSATHPPYFGYKPWWNNHIGKPLNNFFSSGPMSQTEQIFDFHENLAVRGCGCKGVN